MNALCKTCPSARPYQGEDGLGCPLKGSRDGKNALCKKPRKTHASDAAPPVQISMVVKREMMVAAKATVAAEVEIASEETVEEATVQDTTSDSELPGGECPARFTPKERRAEVRPREPLFGCM